MLSTPPARAWRARSPWVVALAASWLTAPPAAAGTVWLCGLSDELTRIVCIADADPDPTAVRDAPAPTARVNGTRFPLDVRRQWTVDLFSPATEPGPVEQLARATLCYRTPDCEVLMHTAVLDTAPAPRPRARLPAR